MNLKSSILRIFSANLLVLFSSIIINFLVPAILSIEDYANVRTYIFYIGYIGFLHFGFIDGMYIKYGGQELDSIDKTIFKNEHITFFNLQIFVTIVFLLVSIVTTDLVIFLMALSIIPINISSFHKLFYQATGQFDKYAKVSYLYTISFLTINIVLAIIFRSKNYILYCGATLISNTIVSLYLEYIFIKNMKGIRGRFDLNTFENIKIGIFILLGNLSVMIFYAMDQWFIKLFFTLNDFSYYSFAISMLNVINLLVSAIATTFYNYLSKEENPSKIIKLKNYFIIIGAFSSFIYFFLAGFISLLLPKYIPSLSIIAILFGAYPYMIIINAIYVNLYKVRKDEKKYLKTVVLMIVVSVIYNMILVCIFETPESIAIGTTFAFITWYIYSSKHFSYLKIKLKEVFCLTIFIISFLYCSHNFNWIIGGGIYFIIIITIIFLFYWNELRILMKFLINRNN